MQGVMIYIVIGAILFIPIGFIAGYFQHKKTLKNNQKNNSNLIKSGTNE